MKDKKASLLSHASFWCAVVLVAWFSVTARRAEAQSQGQNAVYFQSGLSGVCCNGSWGFIEASVFASNPTDRTFCGVLNYILNPTHGVIIAGAVIDARGLNSGNTNMTCTSTTPSPWYGISSPPPSTILLPAGTIVIPSGWVLPNNTKLIGQGDNDPEMATYATPGTTIQAVNSSVTGNMIQFGSSSLCSSVCTGIAVESLTLDGNGSFVNGIVSEYAQGLAERHKVRIGQPSLLVPLRRMD